MMKAGCGGEILTVEQCGFRHWNQQALLYHSPRVDFWISISLLSFFSKNRKFWNFRKENLCKKNINSIFKSLLSKSCRAKPADSNTGNRIALPSKLTEICNFWKLRRNKKNEYKFDASNRKIVMNKYVLELRFLFACKISETYMQ